MEHNNEIELKDVLIILSDYKSELLAKKVKIIFTSILFTILGFLFVFFSQEEYTSELTFIVEDEKQQTGMPSLGGLASTFGFDVGSLSASSTFSQNNIIELLKSRGVVVSTLMQKKNINNKNDLLIEHYIDINGIKKSWIEDDDFNIISFHDNLTYIHDSITTHIWGEIIEDNLSINLVNDDANIIKLSYRSYDQEFAKYFVEVLIDEMGKMYITHQTAQANNTINFLRNRADSVFQELEVSEEQFANVKDINQRIVKASGRLKELQLMRKVEVLNTMYIELIKNLEISKLTLLNQTPIINIIDKPVLPLIGEKNSSRLMSVFLACVLGIICSVLFIIFNKLVKDALSAE